MKKHETPRATLIFVMIPVVFVAVMLGVLWWVAYETVPPDQNKAEKVFQKDREDLETVVGYLERPDCEYISFDKSVKISAYRLDADVEEAIDRLFKKRGYDLIERRGNTVHFKRWSSWSRGYFGSGMAYSINKQDEPRIEYLTELEPLSEDGWYYYEEEYDEGQ